MTNFATQTARAPKEAGQSVSKDRISSNFGAVVNHYKWRGIAVRHTQKFRFLSETQFSGQKSEFLGMPDHGAPSFAVTNDRTEISSGFTPAQKCGNDGEIHDITYRNHNENIPCGLSRVHQINLAMTSNFACVIKVTPPRLDK